MATGHLEKRYKSSWTIIIDAGRDENGNRIRITKSVKGPKRDAEKEMRKMLYEIEAGIFVEPNKLTFGQFLKKWLNDYAKDRVAPKTYNRYEQIINLRVIPKLGNIQIEKLKPLHLQEFYSELTTSGRLDGKEGSLSPSSILYHHRVIHKALDTAVKWQIVARNVADAVEPPKQKKTEIQVLDTDEVVALLEASKDTPYHNLLVVAVLTGMRRGELLGLRWSDIDFNTGKIYVQQTEQYVPGTGIIFKEPKTPGSRRSISMAPQVIEALKAQEVKQLEAKQPKDKEKNSEYYDRDLVFCQDNGKPMHPDTPSSWLPKFLEENKLPRITFKGLRHTCASLLLKQGVRSKVVAEMLGHTTTKITDDIYSHVLPGIQEEAVEKLSKSIFSKISGNEMATVDQS